MNAIMRKLLNNDRPTQNLDLYNFVGIFLVHAEEVLLTFNALL